MFLIKEEFRKILFVLASFVFFIFFIIFFLEEVQWSRNAIVINGQVNKISKRVVSYGLKRFNYRIQTYAKVSYTYNNNYYEAIELQFYPEGNIEKELFVGKPIAFYVNKKHLNQARYYRNNFSYMLQAFFLYNFLFFYDKDRRDFVFKYLKFKILGRPIYMNIVELDYDFSDLSDYFNNFYKKAIICKDGETTYKGDFSIFVRDSCIGKKVKVYFFCDEYYIDIFSIRKIKTN